MPVDDVVLATQGDTAAFERVYRAHMPRIFNLARRMAGPDAAEELTQDVFVRAWQKLALFRGEGLMAWIGFLVVAQNMLTSLFNSHLVDFVPGWMYVLGVGVAGGAVLGARSQVR